MTSISKRLAKGTGIYGLGSALTSAGNFVLIPFYIHYLSPSQYGILATATAAMSFLGIVMGLSLDSALARGYYEHQDDKPGLCRLLSSLFIALALYSAGVLAVLLLCGPWLPAANSLGVAFRPVLATAFIAAYLVNLSTLPLTLLRVQERARVFVLFNVARFVLNNALSIYFVARLRWGAEGSLLGTLFSNVAFALVGVALMWPYLRPLVDREVLRAALAYSLLLMPHVAFFWISNLSDRIVLGHFRGQGEVGIYSLGYNLGMGMSLLTTAFNSSWTPIVFSTLKAGGNTAKAETDLGRTASHALVGFTLAALAFAGRARNGGAAGVLRPVRLPESAGRSAGHRRRVLDAGAVYNGRRHFVLLQQNQTVAVHQRRRRHHQPGPESVAGAAFRHDGSRRQHHHRFWRLGRAGVPGGAAAFSLRFETARIASVIVLSFVVYCVFEAMAPPDLWVSFCGKAAVYAAFIGLLLELGLLTGVRPATSKQARP